MYACSCPLTRVAVENMVGTLKVWYSMCCVDNDYTTIPDNILKIELLA